MKNYILVLALFSCLTASAQWQRSTSSGGYVYTTTTTDKVRVGSGTPTEMLHVFGNSIVTGNMIFGTTASTGLLHLNSATNNFSLKLNATNRINVLNTSGFVGIGNNLTPTEMLHVGGNILGTGNLIFGTTASTGLLHLNSTTNNFSLRLNATNRINVLNSSGFVGIGSNITPTEMLHVGGNILSTGNLIFGTSASTGLFHLNSTTNDFTLRLNATDRLKVVNTTGHVGIGATPTERLHVAGGNILFDNGATPTLYTGTGSTELSRYLHISNSSGLATPSGFKAGGVLVADSYTYANPGKNDLVVKGNLSVGTPFTTTYKLAVNGKIGAKDVQIESSSGAWPDYVFNGTYELPPLSTVEQFIQENGHLKDVPSAREVEKDGYSVSSMDATLLKKIEELTLYVIEQQKEIEVLKKELKSKKKR